MPNYVQNELIITGSKTQVQELLQTISKTQEDYSSNPNDYWILENLYPTPDEEHLTYPNFDQDTNMEITPELLKKYGFDEKYIWRYIHWGVKWPDMGTTLKYQSEKKLHLLFVTPWSPPNNAIEKISMDRPSLSFRLEYLVEGDGSRGRYVWINGELIHNCWSLGKIDQMLYQLQEVVT